jgi:hypothetical protein
MTVNDVKTSIFFCFSSGFPIGVNIRHEALPVEFGARRSGGVTAPDGDAGEDLVPEQAQQVEAAAGRRAGGGQHGARRAAPGARPNFVPRGRRPRRRRWRSLRVGRVLLGRPLSRTLLPSPPPPSGGRSGRRGGGRLRLIESREQGAAAGAALRTRLAGAAADTPHPFAAVSVCHSPHQRSVYIQADEMDFLEVFLFVDFSVVVGRRKSARKRVFEPCLIVMKLYICFNVKLTLDIHLFIGLSLLCRNAFKLNQKPKDFLCLDFKRPG